MTCHRSSIPPLSPYRLQLCHLISRLRTMLRLAKLSHVVPWCELLVLFALHKLSLSHLDWKAIRKSCVNIKEVKLSSIRHPLFLAERVTELYSGHPFGSEPESECFGEGALHQARRASNQTFLWVWGSRVFCWKLLIPLSDRLIDSSWLLKISGRQKSILKSLNQV